MEFHFLKLLNVILNYFIKHFIIKLQVTYLINLLIIHFFSLVSYDFNKNQEELMENAFCIPDI